MFEIEHAKIARDLRGAPNPVDGVGSSRAVRVRRRGYEETGQH